MYEPKIIKKQDFPRTIETNNHLSSNYYSGNEGHDLLSFTGSLNQTAYHCELYHDSTDEAYNYDSHRSEIDP